MPYQTIQEIDQIYTLQWKYKNEIKHSSAQQRKTMLKNLLEKIIQEEKAIEEALYLDFHKSSMETDITEILAVQFEIRHLLKKLSSWMKDKSAGWFWMFPNVSASLHYEPKGNTLIITPWNYPFQLPMVHLASSIAAGNTAILKLSEFSPHINQVIRRIIEAVFPQKHIAVIEGAVEETTHLLSLPFDHIHFTGSPKVGKIVMAAASKHLTDITLELGGKSPAVIDKNVSIRSVVKNIIWAKFVNAGQTCIAPDYLLVNKKIKAELESTFKEEMLEAFGPNPQHSPDYARIINDDQFKRLAQQLEEAKVLGAQIIAGGKMDEKDRYIAPTVITQVANTNKLMQEEIFGPILPIVYYQQIDEAIQLINSKEKPLALYVFSKDPIFNKHIIRHTSAGSTCINDAMIQILHPNLPFAGVNHSGIGQSMGWYGFKSFSHERAIAKSNFFPMSSLFWFPYTEKTNKILKTIKRFL